MIVATLNYARNLVALTNGSSTDGEVRVDQNGDVLLSISPAKGEIRVPANWMYEVNDQEFTTEVLRSCLMSDSQWQHSASQLTSRSAVWVDFFLRVYQKRRSSNGQTKKVLIKKNIKRVLSRD